MLSHSSGGQKCEIKVSAGLIPLEALREKIPHTSLLACGESFWLSAIPGVPWLVDTSLQSLPPLHIAAFSVCLSVPKSPSSSSYENNSQWI